MPDEVPPGDGRARDATRGRPRPRRPDLTGRQHHLGAAPERMPVLLPDGSTYLTRTAAVQLRSRTVYQLRRLERELEQEMQQAAVALDFELAARLRDEVAAVREELGGRT